MLVDERGEPFNKQENLMAKVFSGEMLKTLTKRPFWISPEYQVRAIARECAKEPFPEETATLKWKRI